MFSAPTKWDKFEIHREFNSVLLTCFGAEDGMMEITRAWIVEDTSGRTGEFMSKMRQNTPNMLEFCISPG
jgi:hypothetical protein